MVRCQDEKAGQESHSSIAGDSERDAVSKAPTIGTRFDVNLNDGFYRSNNTKPDNSSNAAVTRSKSTANSLPSHADFGGSALSPLSLTKTSPPLSRYTRAAEKCNQQTGRTEILGQTASGFSRFRSPSCRPRSEKAYTSEQPSHDNLERHPTNPGYTLAAPVLQDASHATDFSQEKLYLLKVCHAFMIYGAPAHRLEDYLLRSADVLGIPVQSFYMPTCMILSFSDTVGQHSEVHLVRGTEALNLSKLYDVRDVYKDVVHKNIPIGEALSRLDGITTQRNRFRLWFRVLMYGLASASIGPVSFGARPIDLPVIFLLGCLLGLLQLVVAAKSELYARVFEISSTIFISFCARGFGSIRLGPDNTFCFSAICQASIVLILPGFTITNSALEIQSKYIVTGSVRMVYGIIYTLFIAFGITIGTTIYGAIDSNATSATTCATIWPFWWKIIFVAPFTLCYIIVYQGKWKKAPTMVILSLIGWVVTYFTGQHFASNAQITQAIGSLTVGILANLYSRLGHGLAIALMHPAIFIQVPGSLAASGSLISGLKVADSLTTGQNGTETAGGVPSNHDILNAGYAMIEIAIGITVGLSVSALVVYPLRNKKGKSGLFTF